MANTKSDRRPITVTGLFHFQDLLRRLSSFSFMKKNEQMRHSGRKRVELNFSWPDPPMNIVLVEQEKQVTIGVAFELVTRSARQT